MLHPAWWPPCAMVKGGALRMPWKIGVSSMSLMASWTRTRCAEEQCRWGLGTCAASDSCGAAAGEALEVRRLFAAGVSELAGAFVLRDGMAMVLPLRNQGVRVNWI